MDIKLSAGIIYLCVCVQKSFAAQLTLTCNNDIGCWELRKIGAIKTNNIIPIVGKIKGGVKDFDSFELLWNY